MVGMRSTLIRLGGAAAVLVGSAGLLITTSSVAGAAAPTTTGTTSPNGPSPTNCSVSLTLVLPLSNVPVTGSLTESCTFQPGSTVTIIYLGVTIETITAPASGLITLTFSAKDPSLSIDGKPYASAGFGINTVTATGINPGLGTNTATFLVDLEKPAATPVSTSATSGSSGLAFTGADLAALIAAALALVLLGTGVVAYTRRRANQVRSS
jgi:hypothetical protein